MRTKFPRSSKGKAGRAGLGEPPTDIFEQPERSLLGEALGRPVGFGAALLIVAAAGTFIANHFVFQMKRIDDFALVAFFVGGGLLLSMLLRTGDPHGASKKRVRKVPADIQDEELVLADPFEEAGGSAAARGLAEAPPASPPVPAAALVEPSAVRPAPDPVDNEVASFQKALIHYVEQGDFHGQGEVLRRLGHLAKSRGHLKESRDFYMNARSCFRKIDDHYAEAAVLLDLGQVLESLDEHDAASAAYRDANRALLDVAMNSGDRYNAVQAHAAD
ncbi:MAG: tetratricopeptide repeat protein [Alphaproteobacteria bacterium]|nr:tetratricopeptide repeat protein [Alphaproteobacteria bacterium]